jgi:hypothetical protein
MPLTRTIHGCDTVALSGLVASATPAREAGKAGDMTGGALHGAGCSVRMHLKNKAVAALLLQHYAAELDASAFPAANCLIHLALRYISPIAS